MVAAFSTIGSVFGSSGSIVALIAAEQQSGAASGT
jgi:hypothetical protein